MNVHDEKSSVPLCQCSLETLAVREACTHTHTSTFLGWFYREVLGERSRSKGRSPILYHDLYRTLPSCCGRFLPHAQQQSLTWRAYLDYLWISSHWLVPDLELGFKVVQIYLLWLSPELETLTFFFNPLGWEAWVLLNSASWKDNSIMCP